MTLVNPKPLGWAFGEIFTSAQANSIGTQLIKAVDGIGGGSYNLLAPLSLNDQTVSIEILQADGLTVTNDLAVGDDLTVAGDAAISGFASFLINNSRVNDANETLFDGFQTTPLRYYTGSTVALQTTISNTTTVYHWFILVNAQSTTRFVNDQATGLNLSLASNSWCIVAKISSLNTWKVVAQGTFTPFA